MGYAFIKFSSAEVSERVLYRFGTSPKTFLFKGRYLKITRHQKSKEKPVRQPVNNEASDVITFEITNVHYGTFIMRAATNNITSDSTDNAFGLIAHRPIINEDYIRIYLRIDTKQRKFSIVVSIQSLDGRDLLIDYAFEWAFNV